MPIELKDLSEVLGIEIEKLDSADDFKKKFTSQYTSKSNVDKDVKDSIVGAMASMTMRRLKKGAKQFGVEVTDAEVEGKMLEDVTGVYFDKIAEKFETEKAAWETNSSKVPDQRVIELETERDKYKNKWNEEKDAKTAVFNQFEEFKSNSANEFKNYKKQNVIADLNSKHIKWATGINEVTKKGFFATLQEKYNFDYTDEGQVVPLDKSGNQIPHPKTVGKFLSYPEVLESEGVAANVWEINNNAKQQQQKVNTQTTQNFSAAPANQQGGVRVAERIRANAAR